MAMLQMVRQLMRLLTPRERLALAGLLALMVIAAGLEITGIGLIMPVVALVAEPQLVEQNHYLRLLHELLGKPSERNFTLLACVAVSAAFILKGAFLHLLTTLQNQLIARLNARWSSALFRRYLTMPYGRFLRADRSAFLHNMHSMRDTCIGFLLPVLMLATEGVVIAAILLLLVWLAPLATLGLAAVVTLVTLGLYGLFRRANLRAGQQQREHQVRLLAITRQGLDGFKECVAYAAADSFFRRYAACKQREARLDARMHVLGQLPRFCIEAGTVTLGMAVLAALVWARTPMASVILTVSVFAMGLLRLMPSLSRVQYYLAMMRQSLPGFRVLVEELPPVAAAVVSAAPTAPVLPFADAIELREVCFRHDGADAALLRGLSVRIPRLSSLAITGPTGCGKTTLADVLLGLLTPESGAVLVDGVDIRTNPVGWLAQVGYVPQSTFLLDASVRENVAFGIDPEHIDDERVREALARAQVLPEILALPDGVHTVCGESGGRLSGGQRQRIGIARALYRQPQVLLLDEATSALDPQTEMALCRALEQLRGQLTIILIAHRPAMIGQCNLHLRLVPPYTLEAHPK